jgi:hypothetical protein
MQGPPEIPHLNFDIFYIFNVNVNDNTIPREPVYPSVHRTFVYYEPESEPKPASDTPDDVEPEQDPYS